MNELRMGNGVLFEAFHETGGNRALINPVTSIRVGVADRDRLTRREIPYVSRDLPPLHSLISLLGVASPGQHILTASITFPWPEPDLDATENILFDRRPSEFMSDHHLIHPHGLAIKFKGNGTYWFKYLVDGLPVGSLPLFVHWEDDETYVE